MRHVWSRCKTYIAKERGVEFEYNQEHKNLFYTIFFIIVKYKEFFIKINIQLLQLNDRLFSSRLTTLNLNSFLAIVNN